MRAGIVGNVPNLMLPILIDGDLDARIGRERQLGSGRQIDHIEVKGCLLTQMYEAVAHTERFHVFWVTRADTLIFKILFVSGTIKGGVTAG